MRWRVDTRFGYASFDESEEFEAREYYKKEGIRLRKCKNIIDEGEVVEGVPLSFNLDREWGNT